MWQEKMYAEIGTKVSEPSCPRQRADGLLLAECIQVANLSGIIAFKLSF